MPTSAALSAAKSLMPSPQNSVVHSKPCAALSQVAVTVLHDAKLNLAAYTSCLFEKFTVTWRLRQQSCNTCTHIGLYIDVSLSCHDA